MATQLHLDGISCKEEQIHRTVVRENRYWMGQDTNIALSWNIRMTMLR